MILRLRTPWGSRTAIVATLYYPPPRRVLRHLSDPRILVREDHGLVQKGTEGFKEADKVDRPALLSFLDEHAEDLVRPTLRNAIERLDPKQCDRSRGRTRE